MFVGARRSSPGMREVRYDSLSGREEDELPMLPVKGAREEVGWRGSSRSSRFAGFYISVLVLCKLEKEGMRTVIGIY